MNEVDLFRSIYGHRTNYTLPKIQQKEDVARSEASAEIHGAYGMV